jgi:hypothetical protein
MKLLRVILAGLVLMGVTALAVVSMNTEPAAGRMTTAAEKFLGTLSAEQKAKAVFDFNDKERTNWYFVPRQTADKKPGRKGLPLADMTAEQRKAALDLVRAGTSTTGYDQATTIMSLESILREQEKGGAMVRDPGWYFFSIFGTPSKTGQWGWRVEGHHLSLNFTIDKGAVVSATPSFFGANPATIQTGPRKGHQPLAGAEKFAKELFDSLDEKQQKVARQPRQFPEIEQAKAAPNVGPPRGLPGARMNDKQLKILKKLLEAYAGRMPPEVGAYELERVEKAGLDKVHFAFARAEDKPGKPYTYRVQGPTFVIEFLNVQADSAGNPANHIHSAWRNIQGDFGLVRK